MTTNGGRQNDPNGRRHKKWRTPTGGVGEAGGESQNQNRPQASRELTPLPDPRELVRVDVENLPQEVRDEIANWTKLDDRSKKLVADASAENTQVSYSFEWTRWLKWCAWKRVSPLPAKVSDVANYLAYLSTYGEDPELDALLSRTRRLAPPSIEHALAVISKFHTRLGLPSPYKTDLVHTVLEGIRRRYGRPPVQKKALLPSDLLKLVEGLGESLIDQRDRALLLLGWAGAFRRSELVRLDVEDVTEGAAGPHGLNLVARVQKSKTDQTGRGLYKEIHASKDKRLCPVFALASWLSAAGIESGPVFRPFAPDGTLRRDRRLKGHAVAEAVQKHCGRVGLDPGECGFAGHSLRRGFVTTSIRAGKNDAEIMKVTGHKKHDTLLRYVETAKPFSEESAGHGLLDGVEPQAPAAD